MTVVLRPQTEALLRHEAARFGCDADLLVNDVLEEGLRIRAAEFDETMAGIERGLKACEEGRTRPIDEYFEEARQRRAADHAAK